jgi:outer membrane lipoprotein LolB
VRRYAPALIAAALLAACAALSEAPLPAGGFEMSGRFAVRYGKDGASGKILWRHSDDADELLITSPLGQGIARLNRDGGQYRLVAGNGREYRANDPERLTQDALGWSLPLAGLPDWVRGRASPGRPVELVRDAGGQALELRQDGWHVTYEEFKDNLPLRLRLSRKDLEIRLIVDRWTN